MLPMLEPKKKSFLPYSEASQLPTTDGRLHCPRAATSLWWYKEPDKNGMYLVNC